jgi:hypothetical protein
MKTGPRPIPTRLKDQPILKGYCGNLDLGSHL